MTLKELRAKRGFTKAANRRPRPGYQVWSYQWSNGYGPIPDRLLFGGKIFRTRHQAEEAWYDTMPGPNDHATIRLEASC